MNMTLFLFGIAVTSSIVVISARNPIHSILALISVVLSIVVILIYYFQAEFLALTFVAVYLGAVVVLFLFIVMMLNVKSTNFSKGIVHALPIGTLVGIIFLSLIIYIHKYNVGGMSNFAKTYLHVEYIDVWSLAADHDVIQLIGRLLFNDYAVLVILVGVILLIAMIGAISLTKTNYIDDSKKRNFVDQQVSRNFENAVFLVNEKKKKK